MILYDFACAGGHTFESWFASSAVYGLMVEKQAVLCPVCGSAQVKKALSVPKIAKKRDACGVRDERDPPPVSARDAASGTRPGGVPDLRSEHDVRLREAMGMVRRVIEEKCDYVGQGFAEEARKIHYGEVEPRPVYGEASPQECDSLREEGIEFASLPWLVENA